MESFMSIKFDQKELERISQLSKTERFALWYDKNTNKFYLDNYAPDTAHYIYDVEQEESPDFIAEITEVVLREVFGDE